MDDNENDDADDADYEIYEHPNGHGIRPPQGYQYRRVRRRTTHSNRAVQSLSNRSIRVCNKLTTLASEYLNVTIK